MVGGKGYYGVATNPGGGKELSVVDSRLLEVSVTYTLKVPGMGLRGEGTAKPEKDAWKGQWLHSGS